ncbi:MAG: uncharacterized membrane protein YraQ (UPF0718 family) [Planctomycetota bacterium]
MGDYGLALWGMLVEAGPWLLLGLVAAGLMQVYLPTGWAASKLGGRGLKPATFAALAGAPLPLCSCSVLPAAAALRKAGASRGATASFLVATPETGLDSVGATWAMLDPVMTLARPLAAIGSAIFTGLAVDAVAHEEEPQAGPEHEEHEEHVHAAPEGPPLKRALRYAFVDLLDDLAPALVIGFLVSGLLLLLLPDDLFSTTVAPGWPTYLVLLVTGMPLYVCATATTPVAAALIMKGVSPGAAMVLLLAGPATNLATLGVVRKLLGTRALWAYLAGTAASALAAGWFVDWIYAHWQLPAPVAALAAENASHGPWASLGGAIFAALLVLACLRLLRARQKRSQQSGCC